MGKKRVAIYCRVSTLLELQESSFELQRDYYLKKVSDDPSMMLVDVYGDQGKTGRSIKARPAFQRLLRDCEAGKIDQILTKSISRFARNLADCVLTIRRLTELKVNVFFEKEHLNTLDQQGELFLSILATIAQEESSSIRRHVRWAHQKRNEVGSPFTNAPYGYRYIKQTQTWQVEHSEAKRVQLAFHMASGGTCYMEIRRALNGMEESGNTGKRWTQSMTSYLLTNLSYTGDCRTNKTCTIETDTGSYRTANCGYAEQFYIHEHHEALISHAVFERVQELMQRGLLNSKRTQFTKEDRELLAAGI